MYRVERRGECTPRGIPSIFRSSSSFWGQFINGVEERDSWTGRWTLVPTSDLRVPLLITLWKRINRWCRADRIWIRLEFDGICAIKISFRMDQTKDCLKNFSLFIWEKEIVKCYLFRTASHSFFLFFFISKSFPPYPLKLFSISGEQQHSILH